LLKHHVNPFVVRPKSPLAAVSDAFRYTECPVVLLFCCLYNCFVECCNSIIENHAALAVLSMRQRVHEEGASIARLVPGVSNTFYLDICNF